MRDEAVDTDRLFRAYATLGLSPSSSMQEVTRAYKKAARQHHADLGGDPAQFEAVINARREIDAHFGVASNILSLARGRAFRYLVAPRTPGFLIASGDPIDGRSRLVRVIHATLVEQALIAKGADGETYTVPFTGGSVPSGLSLRLQGQGEPGRREGVPGDLFLWFP